MKKLELYLVASQITTGDAPAEHGQAMSAGSIKEFVYTEQIHT